MKQQPFVIQRIRLLNFHNFIDETITIPEGGHLFLLGDNGCGKTTVLDAIHYVLTAGQAMEWNSAARVTRRRDSGRRLQGVVLRYNMETGVMNTQGGITYAALEITGRHGKPLSIGVGLAVMGMEETVDCWGFIRECPLQEIPLLISDEHGKRPATKREFKQAMGKSRGFYRDRASYRRELAGRLFGGEEPHREICRFLKMGKAYREIATGAADYHELFKELLPEPHTTIFEQLIDGLRTLDSSRLQLDDLERKVEYIRSVRQLVQDIDRAREALYRYDWLLCYRHSRQNSRLQEENAATRETLQNERIEAQAGVKNLQRQDQQLHERLADLKSKDSSSLVRQEKHVQAELQNKKAGLTLLSSRLKQEKSLLRQAGQEEKRCRNALRTRLGKVVSECGRRTRTLPFSITTLQGTADQLYRQPDSAACIGFDGADIFAQAAKKLRKVNSHRILLESELQQREAEILEQEKRLAALVDQKEPQPGRDIAEVLNAARNEMLSPDLLYLGLEWQPGLDAAEQGRIEETIGEEILATVIFPDNEYETARSLITKWPGVRISCPTRGSEELPDWMRQVFEIKNCNPAALRILAAEMVSDRQPVLSRLKGRDILAFRAHERGLTGHKPRLIGAESRRLALQEEIRCMEQSIAALHKEQTRQQKESNRLQRREQVLETFQLTLHALLKDVRDTAHAVQAAELESAHCRDRYQNRKTDHDALKREVEQLSTRHTELKTLIQREGLAGLDRRISRLEKEWQQNREALNRENQRIGAINNHLEAQARALTELQAKADALEQEMRDRTKALCERLPEVQDIAYYVLKTKTGHQFTSSEAVVKKRDEAERQARSLILELRKIKLNDAEFSAVFRFAYHEEENQVLDFRGRDLVDILPEQEQAVREQRELISDHTRELFSKIIMTDLMNYLRGHVSALEEMMRRINRLLADRSFGGQVYRFRVRPLENYRRLVEMIKKFSPFDPEAEKELRHFFEDHQQEIMAAEVGAVPDELDYRNWYRYELEVATMGEAGVIMDRATKSIGSGGEQAVPNYLLILTIAHFLYRGRKIRLHTLLFDEAFYGIDAGRRDQLLGFASDRGLQLFVASPDQDGARREIGYSTTLFVVKDQDFNIHLRDFHWENPELAKQLGLFETPEPQPPVAFGEEL